MNVETLAKAFYDDTWRQDGAPVLIHWNYISAHQREAYLRKARYALAWIDVHPKESRSDIDELARHLWAKTLSKTPYTTWDKLRPTVQNAYLCFADIAIKRARPRDKRTQTRRKVSDEV